MGEKQGISHGYDDPEPEATLPAGARTVGTSLSGELVVVAHSGQAHVAVTVDRRFVRGLERALPHVDAAAATPLTLDDAMFDRDDVGIPEEIPFRVANAHAFTVHGRDVHVVLHAVGDADMSDVWVELRLDHALLRRIERHRNRDRLTQDMIVAIGVLLLFACTVLTAARAVG